MFIESEWKREPEVLIDPLLTVFCCEQQQLPQAGVQAVAGKIDTAQRPLLEPISADQPCGKNLEDTDTLSTLDAYQIFGQTSLEPPKREPGDPVPKEARKSDRPPNWAEIRDGALSALGASKDLRVLSYLGAAVLRTDGIPAFVRTLGIASHWLAVYPTQVYPLIDEDALFRQNALNCFADPVAVVVLTHEAREGDIRRALAEIDRLAVVKTPARVIRIAG